eukprot:579880-Hanusia_phi.AAC.1
MSEGTWGLPHARTKVCTTPPLFSLFHHPPKYRGNEGYTKTYARTKPHCGEKTNLPVGPTTHGDPPRKAPTWAEIRLAGGTRVASSFLI